MPTNEFDLPTDEVDEPEVDGEEDDAAAAPEEEDDDVDEEEEVEGDMSLRADDGGAPEPHESHECRNARRRRVLRCGRDEQSGDDGAERTAGVGVTMTGRRVERSKSTSMMWPFPWMRTLSGFRSL